jgi:hypothetical protein
LGLKAGRVGDGAACDKPLPLPQAARSWGTPPVFFFASKIFWMLASPINLLLFAALIGVLLCFGRYARLGRGLALAAILILITAASLPVGKLLIAPLEDRFPLPPLDLPPRRVLSCSAGPSTMG